MSKIETYKAIAIFRDEDGYYAFHGSAIEFEHLAERICTMLNGGVDLFA